MAYGQNASSCDPLILTVISAMKLFQVHPNEILPAVLVVLVILLVIVLVLLLSLF